ncbi:MAG: hypothetical protein DRH08_12170, partial [Deltaproteobacteria bacterium]
MRGLSAGAMLYVLLIVCVLLWGPMRNSAVAQAGITIGFSVDGAGLVTSSEQGEEIGRYLESQLSIPVKARSFASEEQLYNWLTRFSEVDVAWLSNGSLAGLPAGKLYALAETREPSSGLLRGEIVVRQGMNSVLRQQLRTAFLSMHENSTGERLLSKLGTSHFVPPALWQTPAWKGIAAPQPAPGSPVHPEEGNAPGLVAATETQIQAAPGTTAKAQVSPETPPPVDVPEALSEQAVSQPQEDPSPVQPVNVEETLSSPVVENERTPSATTSKEINQKAPISLDADYLAYNAEEDSYEAKGDVILSQDGVELRAEEILWQAATQDAAAQGSVQLIDAGTEVYGERLQYNMATGQGQVRDGRVFIPEDNFHLTGELLEKRDQTNYFVENGSFTTCDGEIPDWKFSAKEVDVNLGGYATAKDVWFHIRDVPVFYTPYMLFPVSTERTSGFLMPWFGHSETKGARASLAWYQVIDRHMDATFYLDYLSKIGLGKGLEYRYALENQNNGKALYYHVTGLKGNNDLGYLKWKHRGELPDHWRLTADIEYTDKKRFFEDFGETAEDYNRDKTVSTLMVQRNWQKLNLVSHVRYIKDLENNNDESLQRLPEVGLALTRYRLGDTPFYAGLESYATSFQRDEGGDGERLYLKPSLSAVFTPGSWLEITPEVALHERLYNADADDDESLVPEFSLALATRLVKTFDFNRWGFERIQHSIEPKVVYTYVPDESQDDLPLFDIYDRVERQNNVIYALINRLTASSTAADGSKAYREIFNLRLSQGYDIDDDSDNVLGEDRSFSDLRVELDFKPTSKISLDAERLIPVYGDTNFRTLRVGSSVRDHTGNAVKIDYVYKDVGFND